MLHKKTNRTNIDKGQLAHKINSNVRVGESCLDAFLSRAYHELFITIKLVDIIILCS